MFKDPAFLESKLMLGRKIATGVWWSLHELNYNNTIANENYPTNTLLHFLRYETNGGFHIGQGNIQSIAKAQEYRGSFGLADSIDQILDRYQFLHEMREYFTIGLSLLQRERYLDLQFNSWGTYIGNHQINHAVCLGDTDIKSLIFFQVVQID